MASKVDICNMALSKLPANRVTSLTSETTQEARLCNIFYDSIVDEVIADGVYSTTIRRATLAQLADAPEFEYAYQYQLPTDPFCLKVLTIDECYHGSYKWAIEGDKLLTDLDSVSIRYCARLTDSGSFGPQLTKSIVYRLASELAFPLTGKSDLAERLYSIYEKVHEAGQNSDGQQGSNESLVFNDLTYGR